MRKHWLRKEEVKFEERFNTRFKIMSNIIACILQAPVLTLLCVTEVLSVLFWFLKLFSVCSEKQFGRKSFAFCREVLCVGRICNIKNQINIPFKCVLVMLSEWLR